MSERDRHAPQVPAPRTSTAGEAEGSVCACGARFDDVFAMHRHMDSECANPYSVLEVVSCWRAFNYMPKSMRKAIMRALDARRPSGWQPIESEGIAEMVNAELPFSTPWVEAGPDRRAMCRRVGARVAAALAVPEQAAGDAGLPEVKASTEKE